jgi:RHS repeat-associated protein
MNFNKVTDIMENKYLYNRKELIGDNVLRYYDYGARMYDPVIGRWGVVDPLADHPKQIGMSPYSAFWNNPIRYNDPDGRCPECEENVMDPTDGQSYTSTGGAEYTFGNGVWTRQGGMLNGVTVTAQKPSLLEKSYYRGQAAAQDALEQPYS